MLTELGGGSLFVLGSFLETRAISRNSRLILFLSSAILATPGLLFVFYSTHLLDGAAWFYRFRILAFTEFLPAGMGLLAGVLDSMFEPESLGEKLMVPAALVVLVLIPMVKPLLDPMELYRLSDRCEGEVCMQSPFSACGPSSVATLLREFGVAANERQMAGECLTSRGGTQRSGILPGHLSGGASRPRF